MTETRAQRALVAVCAAVAAFSLLLVLTFNYGRDQGIYATVARTVLDGGMPYRDAWDFKPPGIFLIYALARVLFGSAQIGIRVLEVLGLAAMAWGMVHLAERLWRDRLIGIIAAAVALLVHAQLDFWHTAQPESFGGMVTIAGLVCALAERRKRLAWFAAGALFGFAGLLKPPLVAGAGVVALMLAGRAWRCNAADHRAAMRAALVPLVLVGLGVVTVVAACAAWFAARGALDELVDVLFVFTPGYTKLGWDQPVASMLMRGIVDWMFTYSSLLTAGLLILMIVRPTVEERFGVRLLLAVIAFHIIGVVMQGKFFAYHWGATWPVTALLAGLGIWRLWRSLQTYRFGGAAFFASALFVATQRTATEPMSFLDRTSERLQLLFASDQAGWDVLATVGDVDAGANREVAVWLREHVRSDESIFVWGFEPVIYDLANREPSTRYIYNVPQRVGWERDAARAVLIEELRARPPAAIVVEHGDIFHFVTGDPLDSAAVLRTFDELSRMLRDDYVLETRIQDFELYIARPSTNARTTPPASVYDAMSREPAELSPRTSK